MSHHHPPLVLIEWLDSEHPIPGWTWIGSVERRQPHRCVSVGFLVQDDSDAKVVVSNLGSTGGDQQWDQASGVIVIPAQAVTKIERLTAEHAPATRGWDAALPEIRTLTFRTGQRPAA